MNNTFKRHFKYLTVVAVCASLFACGTPNYQNNAHQNAAAAKRRADNNGMYRVKSGDTLVLIARANNVAPESIMSWNGLSNPNQLEVGWRLRVRPTATRAPVITPYAPQNRVVQVAQPPYNQTYTPPYQPAQTAPTAVYNNSGYNPNPNGYAHPATPTRAIPQQSPTQSRPAVNTNVTPQSPKPAANGNIAWLWPVNNPAVKKAEAGAKGLSFTGAIGTPVLAAAGGEVLYAGNSLRGYGNMIVIKHTEVWSSVYANNNELLVKQGDAVAQGQPIAKMGNSDASKVQMYFEIRWNAKPIDPLKVLPSRVLR